LYPGKSNVTVLLGVIKLARETDFLSVILKSLNKKLLSICNTYYSERQEKCQELFLTPGKKKPAEAGFKK